MKPALIVVIGPTASGKSALAVDLARRWPVELISMDSAQIYRGMDIGTAKPPASLRAEIPHHLIDIRDPAQAYSAAEFAAEARQLCAQIDSRGRIPLLVGGTFLYLRAFLQGLHALPGADPQLRGQLEREAAEQGWPQLHRRLARRDPDSARRIHPNDAQRIQRALEIAELGGATRSEAWQAPRSEPWSGPVLKLCLLPEDREQLRTQIARRFAQMMEEGLLDEVKRLFERGDLSLALPSMRSVGYRQLWQHLQGQCPLDVAVERAIIATRQYAKRQMTWLRREPGLTLLPQDAREGVEQARKHVEEFLAASRP